jgi:death-on-curing protein
VDPVWLGKAVVLAMHARLLADHGGAPGIRDPALLDSALSRPKNLLAYDDPDIYALAAAYTAGVIRDHPFVDGNKRTGFMVGYVFLARNDLQLTAAEVDVAQVVKLLAADEIGESEYAAWLRENCESV